MKDIGLLRDAVGVIPGLEYGTEGGIYLEVGVRGDIQEVALQLPTPPAPHYKHHADVCQCTKLCSAHRT